MSDDRMTPTPVRFPADLTARVDAIAKSMALSHAAVMRLAINQWFEAGSDKTGPFALAKKSAKKDTPKGASSAKSVGKSVLFGVNKE